jgi:hypothetical protein
MKTIKSSRRKSKAHSFRIFRLPPKDFDIRCASERELSVHGIPQRPSAETHPRLRLHWEELAERRPRFVEPRFEPLSRFRRSTVRDQRSVFDTIPGDARPYLTSLRDRVSDFDDLISRIVLSQTSTNWCGAFVKRPIVAQVLNRPHAEPLRVVAGRWTVPSVSLPAAAFVNGKAVDGIYTCGAWVGIDGTSGSGDVLQAGTMSRITVSGGKITGTSYFAWTEWFGLAWIVQSLAVSPGDLIACTVCAPFSNTHGTAVFNNLTTNEAATYGIDPPAKTSLVGNVAEWITEDPGQLSGGLFPFPNFGQVIFTHCVAGTQNVELNVDDATFIDLVDSSNNIRASSYYLNKSSLRCQFVR